MKGMISVGLVMHAAGVAGAQGRVADFARAAGLQAQFRDKVFRSAVSPQWLDGGKRFWYRVETTPGKYEFYMVDARTGAKTPLTGPGEQGAAGLLSAFLPPRRSGNAGEEGEITLENHSAESVDVFWMDTTGGRVKYGHLEPGKSLSQHTFAGHIFMLADASGKPLAAYTATAGMSTAIFDGNSPTPAPPRRPEALSPDGKWRAIAREHDVWLQPTGGGDDVRLSEDGKEGDDYGATFMWSSDGRKLAAIRTESGQDHKVYEVQSSPPDQEQPRLRSFEYLKPGDKIPHPRLAIFDVPSHKEVLAETALTPNPYDLNEFHWAADGHEFYYVYNQRGHQLLRLVAANAATGVVRTVVEETSATFVDYSQKMWVRYLDATGEALWASERTGYNHIYLVKLSSGETTPVTKGEWVVRSVESVDPEHRRLLLRTMGYYPGQDPYHFHYASANFDGSGFTPLTDGDGTHRLVWAPDRESYLDTYSRVDAAPITELRRASDGKRLALLETADVSNLQRAGWQRPERFVAKGRDGKTDIWGVIYRPTNFRPSRRYPVVEYIYAGPHDFFVPKTFAPYHGTDRVTELGFVLVQIDGMGTNWRSKAFHDVCFQNLADAGFPDRIKWIQAAAATRPWMDISRVGIYGTSAGGQSAASAVMRFGDFYKAAVADCGCHDNRMDKIWWNEAWMSWPIGPSYAANSNVTAAKDLKGKLYLMVGEVDTNVDPASTMQVVDALIRAGKDFDLLVVPNSDHGVLGQPYPFHRMQEFFVKNLLGVEPKN